MSTLAVESLNLCEDESDGLRDPVVVVVVVVVRIDGGRDVLLELAAVLSVALFERRRLNGLSCWKEEIELKRCSELRWEVGVGATSLE